ncbi:transposase-like protein [Nesterenkonia sandarakina]|uniref:Transposase-like protein n=1 Tax=Nesterenkonia sandarakina TaxID=272918 RepID=A0A2T0YAW6_9MICC|nr:transposase-like protein [Nesterenkonia sandarakina]
MAFMEGMITMPRPYPPEFRTRAISLVREGRSVKQTAAALGIHEVTLHSWLRQDDIDHGLRPGHTTQEAAELRAARARVRQLEQDISILRRAFTWLDEEPLDPKEHTR